jgi:hypothetical protein
MWASRTSVTTGVVSRGTALAKADYEVFEALNLLKGMVLLHERSNLP